MTRIVVTDPAMLAQFQHLGGQTEVCDPSGNVLGTYSPQARELSPPYAVHSPYSAAELEQFELEPGRPLEDVWKAIGRS